MSSKLLIVTATLLASTTVTLGALADDTPSPTIPVTTGVGVSDAPTTPAAASAPDAPAPASAPASAPGASVATSTSTTTTTSADDVLAAPPPAAMPAPSDATTPVYERRHPHKALFITGASMFLTTYALTASFAAAGERAADRDLFVPGAGPFMNLANRNCARGCTTDSRDTALLVASGVFQNIGAGLMIVSAFIPNKVPVARITAGSMNMHVAPTAGAGAAGLGALGTF